MVLEFKSGKVIIYDYFYFIDEGIIHLQLMLSNFIRTIHNVDFISNEVFNNCTVMLNKFHVLGRFWTIESSILVGQANRT